ncbi:hypothetical protein SDJN03_26469, partial [Cucurbita argyrosperma subsp. sororia]
MAGDWTMIKKLEDADMNGLLQLREDDEDADIRANLFNWWPRSKVRDLKRVVGSEVRIILYDVNMDQAIQTTMRWLGMARYHIEWDIQNKPYSSGDDMLMFWDLRYNRLAYKIIQTYYPEISDACSGTY